MFQVSKEEWQHHVVPNWSQIVTSSQKHRRSEAMPYAFTEQGVAMLSSVLRSDKAIQVNIAIMRAFVAMRQHALTYAELSRKISELEAEFRREFTDIHEVLTWLGEENQKRADETAALNAEPKEDVWQKRERIGFKRP